MNKQSEKGNSNNNADPTEPALSRTPSWASAIAWDEPMKQAPSPADIKNPDAIEPGDLFGFKYFSDPLKPPVHYFCGELSNQKSPSLAYLSNLAKAAYKKASTECQRKGKSLPATVSVMWVPNRESSETGTIYLASGLENQGDVGVDRRPTKGPLSKMHSTLCIAVEKALKDQCQSNKQPKGVGPIGHRNNFACGEMHMAQFALDSRDKLRESGAISEKFGSIFPEGTIVCTYGIPEKGAAPSIMNPCSDVGKGNEANERQYPENTVGCHLIYRALNIQYIDKRGSPKT